jgi:hypothetical protein
LISYYWDNALLDYLFMEEQKEKKRKNLYSGLQVYAMYAKLYNKCFCVMTCPILPYLNMPKEFESTPVRHFFLGTKNSTGKYVLGTL